MKFDITKRLPAVDDLIAKTTNKRHWAILENFRRHSILENCGYCDGILEPDMIVPHPVYRIHTPTTVMVYDGMDEVRQMYADFVAEKSTVMYHINEHVAVSDDGIHCEYLRARFYPGKVLAARGDAIDDPEAVYLETLTQAMYWPYDDQARVIEERVYRGNDRKFKRCEPEEVITVEECREKLMPLLRPVASPY